jgi:hypothetical protein
MARTFRLALLITPPGFFLILISIFITRESTIIKDDKEYQLLVVESHYEIKKKPGGVINKARRKVLAIQCLFN